MGDVRDDLGDESYFEPRHRVSEGFDAGLLREPLNVIPGQRPVVLKPDATVTDAMRAMQREHRSCVLVTDDGTRNSKLIGIFTERDVLFRIVDKGRNPAALPVGEVMTPDPESLSDRSSVAYVLNKMAVGGFRHVPVVDDEHRPVSVISVRNVVSFLVEAFPREVLNLPTEPGVPSTGSREGAQLLGRRPDARPVPDAAPMRRIMPHVSPRRNDSVFHLAQDVDVEAALEFLEKRNRERPADRPATLFHLLLRSLSQGMVLRPGINRFVKGGRLWQRDGIFLTFSAKRELVDGAPLLTIKRRFEPERESLDEMIDAVYDRLRPARRGVESTSDKETNLLLRLPNALTGALVRGADALDRFGLLPRAMIDPDPLFTSMFVANLGSVGHDAGFHHLWERGTCSSFCVMGRIKPGPAGRRIMTLCWTYDERIEDGLYSYGYTNGVQQRLEQPELLLASPAQLD